MENHAERNTEVMDSHSTTQTKQKGIPTSWKVGFSILLIIHIIFFFWLVTTWLFVSMGAMVFIVAIPLGYLLAIITFITVLFFVRKQKPQGVAKYISYTYLAIVSLFLVIYGDVFINSFFN